MQRLSYKTYFLQLLFSLCVLCFGILQTAIASPPVLDRLVASVNGEAITESDLKVRTKLLMLHSNAESNVPSIETLQKQLVEKMIIEKLQLQLATPEELKADPAAVDAHLADIAAQDNLSTEEFKSFLNDQDINVEKFRQWIQNEITLSKVQQREIGQSIHVSQTEISNFLNSAAGQDQIGIEYRLAHILIALPDPATTESIAKAREETQALVKALKQGANFSTLAMEHSAAAHAFEGGDLGWHKVASLPTLFAKRVPGLSVGTIEGPIEDSSGFHIIKLLDKRQSTTDGAQLKNKATEALYRRKFEEQLSQWLKQLRADSQVDVFLNAASQTS